MSASAPALLITDDDVGFRETLSDIFEDRGFRTVTAADGEEAVHIVRQEEIHVVLVDMHMPKLTGLETIRTVRRFRALLPFILMSADADQGVIEQALAWQSVSFLPKPISRVNVLDAVQQALRRTYNWPQ